MKRPIFVRPFNDAERKTLEAGLRSPDAFTLRRCQILLASSRGENAYQIARSLGCNPQTVRNAIHAFNEEGLPGALQRGSKRPHTIQDRKSTRPNSSHANISYAVFCLKKKKNRYTYLISMSS